jgi:hypothetical protein
MIRIAAVVLFLLAVAYAQKPKDEGWTDLLPAGTDRELVLNSCNSCHNMRVVVDARKSRPDWAKCVNDMIQRGAPLFPEEIDPIVGYLSKAFPPDLPKLVNVNTATKEDLAKLPNLSPEIATRVLDARTKAGPFKNAESLRQALGMEKPDFQRIASLLKYRD